MFNFIRRWFLRAEIRKLAGRHQFQGQPLSKWILDLLEMQDSIDFVVNNPDKTLARLRKSLPQPPNEPSPTEGGPVIVSITAGGKDYTPSFYYLRTLTAKLGEMVKSLGPVTPLIFPVLLEVVDRGGPSERLSAVRLLAEFETAEPAVSNKLHQLATDPNETHDIRQASKKALDKKKGEK